MFHEYFVTLVTRLKVEEKNAKPFVMIFHDFLSSSEVDYIKSNASDSLERSIIGMVDQAKRSFVRTSKQAWLSDITFNIPMEILEEVTKNGSRVEFVDKDKPKIPWIPYNVMRYLTVIDHKVSLIIIQA